MKLRKVLTEPLIVEPNTIYLVQQPNGKFNMLVSTNDGNELKELNMVPTESGSEQINPFLFTGM